jgi:predicted RNase H-like HicB family nuclease
MTTYALYLESGPQHKTTMVHVIGLLGCVATGPTTDAALEATPDAIRAYLRLLKRTGEKVDLKTPITVRVETHFDKPGGFIGQGAPVVTVDTDLEPVTKRQIGTYLARFHTIRETMASWIERQSAKQLDAAPKGGGRPPRKMVLHVLPVGGYLSPALGGAPGFGAIVRQAERNEMPLADALRASEQVAVNLLRPATDKQRSIVVERHDGVRTLHKAIRRTLEHDWEHLSELARREGGPKL